MPTYQYACTECGHTFEQFQSFSDDALTECPQCQGRLRKLFNAVGVVFKGSGFYRNDSRGTTTSSESGSSSEKSDSTPSEKSGSTSGDKPAAKPVEKAASTSSSSSSSSASSSSSSSS